ncbi:hypothetical protein AB0M44_22025 [Streptosporangium subroseum]|uniref:hypothetical protein n=1 Tax=Streptosporangium subroseum TaxID=106412 RepID=UPI0034330276
MPTWFGSAGFPLTPAVRNTISRDQILAVEVEIDRTCLRKDKDEPVLAVGEGRNAQAEAASITVVAGEIGAVVVAWGRRSVTAGRVSARTRPGRSRRCSTNP